MGGVLHDVTVSPFFGRIKKFPLPSLPQSPHFLKVCQYWPLWKENCDKRKKEKTNEEWRDIQGRWKVKLYCSMKYNSPFTFLLKKLKSGGPPSRRKLSPWRSLILFPFPCRPPPVSYYTHYIVTPKLIGIFVTSKGFPMGWLSWSSEILSLDPGHLCRFRSRGLT